MASLTGAPPRPSAPRGLGREGRAPRQGKGLEPPAALAPCCPRCAPPHQASHGTPAWLLQEVAGEPLYMLLRAIQYQVDKGPVDAVTGKAKRTLNDSRLLREDVEFRPLTLMVLAGPGAGGAAGSSAGQRVPARVLDTDTITQVKEKVLDQVYRGTPFSQRPSVHALDLGESPPAREGSPLWPLSSVAPNGGLGERAVA